MKRRAKVELILNDGTKEVLVIEYTPGMTARTDFNRVDRAVEKLVKDKDWVRWNLLDLGR